MADIRVHIASINTRSATELCIRSALKYAGMDFELVVGDGGSNDGSLRMLRLFEGQGKLILQQAVDSPMHGVWLDRWKKECPQRYCMFADSDVEFLHQGWLADMMAEMNQTDAAMVCAHMTPANPHYVHPVYQVEMVLAARPSPWLMLLDLDQVRDIPASFLFHEEPSPEMDFPTIHYDVAGYFFHEMVARGLAWRSMPEGWLVKVHHFGGMSWGLPGGGGSKTFLNGAPKLSPKAALRTRVSIAKKRLVVHRHLARLR